VVVKASRRRAETSAEPHTCIHERREETVAQDPVEEGAQERHALAEPRRLLLELVG
jgi:hypothetical protein